MSIVNPIINFFQFASPATIVLLCLVFIMCVVICLYENYSIIESLVNGIGFISLVIGICVFIIVPLVKTTTYSLEMKSEMVDITCVISDLDYKNNSHNEFALFFSVWEEKHDYTFRCEEDKRIFKSINPQIPLKNGMLVKLKYRYYYHPSDETQDKLEEVKEVQEINIK